MSQQPESMAVGDDSVVSFQTEMPLPLQQAMTRFIEGHPNWDQYRLVQAALAGFLVQNALKFMLGFGEVASQECPEIRIGCGSHWRVWFVGGRAFGGSDGDASLCG